MPSAGRTTVSSNWIDWPLTALGIFIGLSFLISSRYTLGGNNPLSLLYIQAAVLLLAYAFWPSPMIAGKLAEVHPLRC